jgi:hypothetical protein
VAFYGLWIGVGTDDRLSWVGFDLRNGAGRGGLKMRKLVITGIAALAFAAPAGAGATKLVVVMKDPGCHWSQVGGKYKTSVTRRGPVTLVNFDEGNLKVSGPGGTRLDRVGAKLTLRAKGVYRIVMVHQATDDNHLKLTIK